jgi:DtxR family Mn-dependent transcriptional regulator
MSTISEENYIKSIFKLSEELDNEVTTNAIAERLETKASSVTDMIQKLAEKKLVNYKKYQGVTLTNEGEILAVKIIRKHRLWELFLYQTLGFKWDEIHDIAEELEHIKSEVLVERLDKFLNYPNNDPHGDPIPDKGGKFPEINSIQLSLFRKNIKGIVVGVNNKSSAFLAYLDKMGIHLGTEMEIIEWYDFDHSADIRMDNVKLLHLSYQAVQNILMVVK